MTNLFPFPLPLPFTLTLSLSLTLSLTLILAITLTLTLSPNPNPLPEPEPYLILPGTRCVSSLPAWSLIRYCSLTPVPSAVQVRAKWGVVEMKTEVLWGRAFIGALLPDDDNTEFPIVTRGENGSSGQIEVFDSYISVR